MRKLAALLLPLLLACGHPSSELMRRQPPPPLALELAVPDAPDQPNLKRIYEAAFREAFGAGLTPTPANQAETIQLIVVVGRRTERTEAEAKRNATMGMAGSVAARSPLGLVNDTLGAKAGYEGEVERLGYRPREINGQVLLMVGGKQGFTERLSLEPPAILKHMRSLGEQNRTAEGIMAEEGRALALETLALLKRHFGWVPPRP